MIDYSNVIADKNLGQAIKDGLEDAGIIEVENTIIVQSPLFIKKQKENCFHVTLVEVFPLWLEYYKYFGKLNNPWKVIVFGIESQYQDLSYYVTPFKKEKVLGEIEKLLVSKYIDYSLVPCTCSGKDAIINFFYGHGEKNIKGILGKITDYIRNGILMVQEGENIEEVKNLFFKQAQAHLEQLKLRLGKYRPLLEYLPWEKEIKQLDNMIITLEPWVKEPNFSEISCNEILKQMRMVFDDVSLLMKIHKIFEE